MADELFEELDSQLPDIDMTAEDIQKEVKAFRNTKKKKS